METCRFESGGGEGKLLGGTWKPNPIQVPTCFSPVACCLILHLAAGGLSKVLSHSSPVISPFPNSSQCSLSQVHHPPLSLSVPVVFLALPLSLNHLPYSHFSKKFLFLLLLFFITLPLFEPSHVGHAIHTSLPTSLYIFFFAQLQIPFFLALLFILTLIFPFLPRF